jgi:hypothetical protein
MNCYWTKITTLKLPRFRRNSVVLRQIQRMSVFLPWALTHLQAQTGDIFPWRARTEDVDCFSDSGWQESRRLNRATTALISSNVITSYDQSSLSPPHPVGRAVQANGAQRLSKRTRAGNIPSLHPC